MFINSYEQQQQSNKKTSNGAYISFKSLNTPNQSTNQQQITPWFSKSTKEIKDPLLRFHNEIIEFYEYVSPTVQSHQIRLNLFKKVKNIIEEVLPNAKVRSFGSFKTKLYLPDSDMDIAVLMNSQQDDKSTYNTLYQHFKTYQGQFKQIQFISKAKIPIIKFIESQYQIPFDVSVNRQDGLQHIEHVERALNTYPQLKYIIFVLKCMLRIRGLDQPFTGGLSSYSLFSMIIGYLRQAHNYKKYYLTSEHILKFLQYYSGKMDRMSAYIRNETMNEKQPLKSYQEQGHDISRSAFNFRDILKMFNNRYRLISNYNFSFGESILKYLVSPSSEKFRYAHK